MNTMNVREEVPVTRTTVVAHAYWSSIFAGTVISMIVLLTLAILGLAIGLSTIEPATEARPFAGIGTGSLVWWAIISIISLFIGGWVASRMAGIQRAMDGALHGLVTWGLSTLVLLFLITSTVGAVIGGGLSLVRNAAMVGGVTGGAAAAQQPGTTQGIANQLRQAVPQNATPQQRQQIEQQARTTGQQVAKGAATGAFGTFILLVLEGVAAAWGGAVGRNKGPVRAS